MRLLFPEAKKLTRRKISTFQQCLRKLLFSASHDLILAPQIKSTAKTGPTNNNPPTSSTHPGFRPHTCRIFGRESRNSHSHSRPILWTLRGIVVMRRAPSLVVSHDSPTELDLMSLLVAHHHHHGRVAAHRPTTQNSSTDPPPPKFTGLSCPGCFSHWNQRGIFRAGAACCDHHPNLALPLLKRAGQIDRWAPKCLRRALESCAASRLTLAAILGVLWAEILPVLANVRRPRDILHIHPVPLLLTIPYQTQEAPKRAKSVATTVAEPLPALELQQISRDLQGAVPKFPLCAGQSCQQRDFSRSPPSALSPISAPYPARRRKCSRQAWTMNQRTVEAVAHQIPDYPTMAPWDGPWMAKELQEG